MNISRFMSFFYTKHKIDELKVSLPREFIQTKSRILIIDDEKPEIIADLQKARFAVDYLSDITADNLRELERPEYDLIILDFGNVGTTIGDSQGLDLLKHIKRVRPSAVVLAYTSKALMSEHAEFFRLADGVLSKDAGVVESIEIVEKYLRKAHDITNLWNGILLTAGIDPGSKEDLDRQDLYVRALTNPKKLKKFRDSFADGMGQDAAKAAGTVILEKLIETGIKSLAGG